MRIFLNCIRCFKENGQPSEEFCAAQLEDSGLYRMTCTAGHETVTCLQQMKFEVLFDLGAYALVDGYHREAVSSFTSALERFFEFYIDVSCAGAKINEKEYLSTWKLVANQSERQLGAFVFVHTLCAGHAPALLAKKDVEFRNAVIHKGQIPTKGEAFGYGQRVLNIILPVLDRLRRDLTREVDAAVNRHIRRQRQSVKLHDVAFMTISTLLSLNRNDRQPSFDEWVEMLDRQRNNRLAATIAHAPRE